MITSHVWRPPFATGGTQRRAANRGLCAFMNCGRAAREHARSVADARYARAKARQP